MVVEADSRQPFRSYHYDRVMLYGLNEKTISLPFTYPASMFIMFSPEMCSKENFSKHGMCLGCSANVCPNSQSCYCFCGHRERQGIGARKTQQFSGQEKQTLKENQILPEQMTKKIIKTSDDILLCPDGVHLCLLKKNSNEQTKLPFPDMTKSFMKS